MRQRGQVTGQPPDRPTEPSPDATDWWRRAVVYQIYIRSFADGDGDGAGEIAGIRARPPYLPAPVVPGGSRRRSRPAAPPPLRLRRRPGRQRRRAAQQLAERLRRPRLGPGHRAGWPAGPGGPPRLRPGAARPPLGGP